jgi:hypothetical protein
MDPLLSRGKVDWGKLRGRLLTIAVTDRDGESRSPEGLFPNGHFDILVAISYSNRGRTVEIRTPAGKKVDRNDIANLKPKEIDAYLAAVDESRA